MKNAIILLISLSIVSVVTNEPPTHKDLKASAIVSSAPERVETTKPTVPQVETKQVPKQAESAPEPTPTPAPTPTPVITDAETVMWDHFIKHGYTREQTAGIIGNFHQEHGLQTSDVPGGLGIAQWLGGRRGKLLVKPNPYDLQTQLDFVIEELNDKEHKANTLLKMTSSVSDATLVFQNQYERCNPVSCNYSRRLMFAQEVLRRH